MKFQKKYCKQLQRKCKVKKKISKNVVFEWNGMDPLGYSK